MGENAINRANLANKLFSNISPEKQKAERCCGDDPLSGGNGIYGGGGTVPADTIATVEDSFLMGISEGNFLAYNYDINPGSAENLHGFRRNIGTPDDHYAFSWLLEVPGVGWATEHGIKEDTDSLRSTRFYTIFNTATDQYHVYASATNDQVGGEALLQFSAQDTVGTDAIVQFGTNNSGAVNGVRINNTYVSFGDVFTGTTDYHFPNARGTDREILMLNTPSGVLGWESVVDVLGGQQSALTPADASAVNSGDGTTDTVINNMRTRINELEAKLQALTLIA